MNAREIAELVKRMRDAQKAFFAHRDRRDLGRAQQLEREVDTRVEEILHPKPSLFGEGR